jgi:hypothetical protein
LRAARRRPALRTPRGERGAAAAQAQSLRTSRMQLPQQPELPTPRPASLRKRGPPQTAQETGATWTRAGPGHAASPLRGRGAGREPDRWVGGRRVRSRERGRGPPKAGAGTRSGPHRGRAGNPVAGRLEAGLARPPHARRRHAACLRRVPGTPPRAPSPSEGGTR